MKKLLILAFAMSCSFASQAIEVKSDANVKPETGVIPVDPAADRLTKRIEEINAMDKSTLTRQQRKELRREVRKAKDQAIRSGGGLYISAGAILIIILLLILL